MFCFFLKKVFWIKDAILPLSFQFQCKSHKSSKDPERDNEAKTQSLKITKISSVIFAFFGAKIKIP